MNELSLFSGAGGGLLATKHLLGWRCVGYVEIEKYPQEVLKARIRDGLLDAAPIFGDIRRFISEGYAAAYQGMVDVVTGGFPCQDISCAGKGAGITGERSGLWKSMAEVVRQVEPEYVFVENSPHLVSKGLGMVLSDLAGMGFDAEWGAFQAGAFGFPQSRKRFYLLAHSMRGNRPLEGDFSRGRWKPEQIEKYVVRSSASEPSMVGVADGMADRMGRLKAIGNGWVPRVAEIAWKILSGER